MADFEVAIIGAGVVGLALAARLAPEFGAALLLLEQHQSFGRETSSRNSEVIHAGIYYPENSLKARLCRAGQRQLYELAQKFALPYRRIGKLIVAGSPAEEEQLEKLRQRGLANGVSSLEPLSGGACQRLEPAVRALSGLYSPATGIIDSHALMAFFVRQAQAHSPLLAWRNRVEEIQREPEGYRLNICGRPGENFAVTARMVINSAGLAAARLSRGAGIPTPPLYFAKGVYFAYRGRSPLNHLVYPAPNPAGHGLGVHATLDLGGRLRFGPDLEYCPEPDYQVANEKKSAFAAVIKSYLPALDENRLEPDLAGVRPRLQGPGDPVADFIIREENEAGFPGFFNLLGIESPGLTAAPAIADEVAARLGI